MADDDKALVKLLRVGDPYEVGDARHKAADRIEALSAENERLREALDRLAEASSKTLTEMISRGNALETLEAEKERMREALISSTKCLRETASRVGSMHGYWDIIFDNESILRSFGDTK